MDVKVPDIGDFAEVPVVSILVAVGDEVAAEDPLIELESDKATMEVPSPAAGKVAEIKVAEGDKVSEGSVIIVLEGVAGGGGGAGAGVVGRGAPPPARPAPRPPRLRRQLRLPSQRPEPPAVRAHITPRWWFWGLGRVAIRRPIVRPIWASRLS
ncbi:biotin/lipoyl-containing protein [Microbulbifer sp. S227A]|uniref:biotin/lipoyl-containing protein n=1 Tax=Microbulbifer sp. S227A TaxID=3415131 RepID=UPI003C79E0E7